MLFEGFNLGFFAALLSFSLWPFSIMLIFSIIYIVFYAGWRFYIKVLGSIMAGIILSGLLFGFSFDYTTGSISTYISAIVNPLLVLALVVTIRGDFNRSRTKVRKNKEHLEELSSKLSRYLSPQVYSQIFLGKREAKLESYRKKLTVFFSDIVGFTRLTDTLEPEDMSFLLNSYLDDMSKIALKHGGTIDKFIGDAILIFFGDPESNGEKEDALACISMALEMQEHLVYLNRQWQEKGLTQALQVRMGINTGFCTVGNFGSEDHLDYTILGGQVNLSSRLETNALPGEILVSHETYALIKNNVICKPKPELTVKGISNPIKTYSVHGLKDQQSAPFSNLRKDLKGLYLSLDFEEIEANEAIEVIKNIIEEVEQMNKNLPDKGHSMV